VLKIGTFKKIDITRLTRGPEVFRTLIGHALYINLLTREQQTAFVESFSGRLRDECLHEHSYATRNPATRPAFQGLRSARLDHNKINKQKPARPGSGGWLI